MSKNLFKLLVVAGLATCIVALLYLVIRVNAMGLEGELVSSRDSSLVHHYDTALHIHTARDLQPINHYYYMPANVPVDSLEIVRSFFTKNTVKDILDDSLITVTTIDSLYMNSIVSRLQTYKLKKPYLTEKTVTVTNTHIKNASGIFAGAFISFQGRGILSAGPELQLVTRRNAFGIGYDVFNRAPQAKILFNLHPHR